MGARRMGLVTAGLTVVSLAVAGLAAASDGAITPITRSTAGTQDGWHYVLFKESGDVSMSLGPAGQFSTTWNVDRPFFAGKGLRPGGTKPVSYSATVSGNGSTMVALHGWFTGPLAEYLVVDSWTAYNPSTGMTRLATITTDGGVYDLYRSENDGMLAGAGPSTSILGSSFSTYWSIRQNRRTSGTISIANHLDAWSKLGLQVSTFDYQVLAAESYFGAGQASVVVTSPTPTAPTTTSPTSTSPSSTSPTSTSPTSTSPSTAIPRVTTKCRTDKKGRATCRTITKKPKKR